VREILLVDPGSSIGGTEKVVVDSARRLVARGERVAALASADRAVDAFASDLAAAGARVERAGGPAAPIGGFEAMVRRLRARPPDILHAHLPWPHACPWLPLASRMAGVRSIVATEHLLFPETHLRDDLRKRFGGAFVDRAIAVSTRIAETLVSRWGYPLSRVVVVPNGVDLAQFPGPGAEARSRGRRALGLDENALLVGSVGRLEEQKGFGNLVRAAARLLPRFPELGVAIAGEGSLAGTLRDDARRTGLGERLHLPGRIAAIPDFLAALDLFVLPSHWEGMPLSLLEAMAMGIPVVATGTPGALEIFAGPERVGVAVTIGNDEMLAESIAALLSDREAARALGLAGLARVRERHDAARLFERVVAVYDAVSPREDA